MIIVAWNGSGQPTSIFNSDVFKKSLSVFITAAIFKLGQGRLASSFRSWCFALFLSVFYLLFFGRWFRSKDYVEENTYKLGHVVTR